MQIFHRGCVTSWPLPRHKAAQERLFSDGDIIFIVVLQRVEFLDPWVVWQEEARMQGIPVGIHTLSPGMVLTDLLLDGATDVNKQIFNVLCEQPETVAAFLVPRARTVAGPHSRG